MLVYDKIGDRSFTKYIRFIHENTGITIPENRRSMLISRIRKRLRKLRIPNYRSYLTLIKNSKEEKRFFINLITTNETYFYRTPRIWRYIEDEFLPKQAATSSKVINIWSAAASTGEEAHTLGVLCQNFKDNNVNFRYKIMGSDISTSVIEKATEGKYLGRSIQRFKEARWPLFQKYMIGNETIGYQVLPQIKNNIHFTVHNLFHGLTENQKFDLILLRNVLIYFSKVDKEEVLKNLHRKLNPGGNLIIGESESLNSLHSNFESVAPLIYRLKDGSRTSESIEV